MGESTGRWVTDAVHLPLLRRPETRGECTEGWHTSRPCEFVDCEWNSAGLGSRRAPSRPGVCVLDRCDAGESTLAEIAEILQVTREAVRLVEERALRKLARLGVTHRELRALREHSYAEPRHSLVRLRDER